MKKTLVIALAALLSWGASAQNKDYKLELSFRDSQAGGKYVFKSKDLPENFSDTIALSKDGEKITFKKPFTEPFFLTCSYIKPGEARSSYGANVFFDAPRTLSIVSDSVDYLTVAPIRGGVYDHPALQASFSPYGDQFRTVLTYMKEGDKTKVDSLIALMNSHAAKVKEFQRQYIVQEPGNDYSAALLDGMLRDSLPLIEPLYEGLTDKVKAGKYGKPLAEKLDAIRAIQVGKPAPEFALNDIDGQVMKLADFRGKWVLLDFWGSWCIWCRKGNPALVDLYDKYGGKDFEIIGLAARDKEENWKKAIEEDHLTWKHANLALTEGGNDLPAKYNISGYPTKILVDPEGRIAVISVGYHETDDPVTLKLVEELGETYVK